MNLVETFKLYIKGQVEKTSNTPYTHRNRYEYETLKNCLPEQLFDDVVSCGVLCKQYIISTFGESEQTTNITLKDADTVMADIIKRIEKHQDDNKHLLSMFNQYLDNRQQEAIAFTNNETCHYDETARDYLYDVLPLDLFTEAVRLGNKVADKICIKQHDTKHHATQLNIDIQKFQKKLSEFNNTIGEYDFSKLLSPIQKLDKTGNTTPEYELYQQVSDVVISNMLMNNICTDNIGTNFIEPFTLMMLADNYSDFEKRIILMVLNTNIDIRVINDAKLCYTNIKTKFQGMKLL